MSENNCLCGCCAAKTPQYQVPTDDELTLAELPIGSSGRVVKIKPELRGRKKFADVGLVAGSELKVEAYAPFGGLMRVRVMESSMALHCADAENIVMKRSAEE
jgi:Fe2+ transport system protein FeoA